MPTSKRERQRDNRAKKLEEQRKIEQRRRFRRRAVRFGSIALAVLAVLFIASLIGRNEGDSATTTSVPAITTTTASGETTTTTSSEPVPQSYADYRELPTACGAEAPPPVEEMTFDAPEDQGIPAEATVTATIATSCGNIVAELDPAAAPETVNSFVFLARIGYFDGSVFHRIADGFVVQGGDPTATGSGGPGYTVPDEFPDEDFRYTQGVLAMANSGPGTTGSQFFVMLADGGLPPSYSAFGNAVDSDETLQKIAAVPVGLNPVLGEMSVPLEAVYIESVAVEIDQ